MERRVRERKRSIRERNLADHGDAYTDFERMAKLSLPPWPIRQCTSQRKYGGRCRNRIGNPGQVLCRRHFGTTWRNRKIAIRRFAIWVLCGLPMEEEGLLELLAGETISELLSQKPFYTALSIEAQVAFLSALIGMSGIVDLNE